MLKNQLKIKVITLSTLVLLLVVSSIFLIKSTNALDFNSNREEIINSINTTDTTYIYKSQSDGAHMFIAYTDDLIDLYFNLLSWEFEYSYNFIGDDEQLVIRIESIIIKGYIQLLDSYFDENIIYEYELQLVQPNKDSLGIYSEDIVWYTGILKEDLLNENVIHSKALQNINWTEYMMSIDLFVGEDEMLFEFNGPEYTYTHNFKHEFVEYLERNAQKTSSEINNFLIDNYVYVQNYAKIFFEPIIHDYAVYKFYSDPNSVIGDDYKAFDGFFSNIFESFSSILNVEIFPGITLAFIVGIPLLLGLLLIVLKFIRG